MDLEKTGYILYPIWPQNSLAGVGNVAGEKDAWTTLMAENEWMAGYMNLIMCVSSLPLV